MRALWTEGVAPSWIPAELDTPRGLGMGCSQSPARRLPLPGLALEPPASLRPVLRIRSSQHSIWGCLGALVGLFMEVSALELAMCPRALGLLCALLVAVVLLSPCVLMEWRGLHGRPAGADRTNGSAQHSQVSEDPKVSTAQAEAALPAHHPPCPPPHHLSCRAPLCVVCTGREDSSCEERPGRMPVPPPSAPTGWENLSRHLQSTPQGHRNPAADP